MKKVTLLLILPLLSCLLYSCGGTKLTKKEAYKGMYEEKPLSVLIMPPINRSTNIESKEYFHSTLNAPLSECGYYVIPPFLSMEILKRESAYDAELFLDNSLSKFREVFGADIALFTIIHKWDKNALSAKVKVDVEYIIKSTISNEMLYSRYGSIIYDASVSTNAGGIYGALADLALSAISTAVTDYVPLARACNNYTFSDLPKGSYHPKHNLDQDDNAGAKKFRVRLQ